MLSWPCNGMVTLQCGHCTSRSRQRKQGSHSQNNKNSEDLCFSLVWSCNLKWHSMFLPIFHSDSFSQLFCLLFKFRSPLKQNISYFLSKLSLLSVPLGFENFECALEEGQILPIQSAKVPNGLHVVATCFEAGFTWQVSTLGCSHQFFLCLCLAGHCADKTSDFNAYKSQQNVKAKCFYSTLQNIVSSLFDEMKLAFQSIFAFADIENLWKMKNKVAVFLYLFNAWDFPVDISTFEFWPLISSYFCTGFQAKCVAKNSPTFVL